MSLAARSIFWFSLWVLACGLALLLGPLPLLRLMSIDPAARPVAQIFGMVLLFLGFYYFMAGRQGRMADFYRWTVYTRAAAFGIALALVVTGQLKSLLLAFVAVDVAGAAWTALALRQDARRAGAD